MSAGGGHYENENGIERLRRQDAAVLRQRLTGAREAVGELLTAWGLWADDVRWGAERRLGPEVPDKTLWADPDYSRALDGGKPIAQAQEAIRDAEQWFGSLGAVTGEAEPPEAEAGL